MDTIPDNALPIRDQQRLDPLLEWNLLSNGTSLQVRFPDGRHITFDRDAAQILECLLAIESGGRSTDSITSSLLAILDARSAFSSIIDAGCDWALDVYDYVFRQGNAALSENRCCVRAAREVPIANAGNGWMNELAKQSTRLLGFENVTSVDSISSHSLLIAASDRYDPSLFSSINAISVGAGSRVLFVHRHLGRLVIGPLVIPGKTACYHCYQTRRRASARFKDEFDANARENSHSDRCDRHPSVVAKGLCQSLISLHILGAAAEAYDLFEPGTIYSYDVVSMEKLRQPILKVTGCRACSANGDAPPRAVRAIA